VRLGVTAHLGRDSDGVCIVVRRIDQVVAESVRARHRRTSGFAALRGRDPSHATAAMPMSGRASRPVGNRTIRPVSAPCSARLANKRPATMPTTPRVPSRSTWQSGTSRWIRLAMVGLCAVQARSQGAGRVRRGMRRCG
jgi:hypothetical protein